MSKEKEVPEIKVEGDTLTITITAEDLKWIYEHDPNYKYTVLDQNKLLKDFAHTLECYQTQNSKETGFTGLQEFLERIKEETYTDGSEALTGEDLFP